MKKLLLYFVILLSLSSQATTILTSENTDYLLHFIWLSGVKSEDLKPEYDPPARIDIGGKKLVDKFPSYLENFMRRYPEVKVKFTTDKRTLESNEAFFQKFSEFGDRFILQSNRAIEQRLRNLVDKKFSDRAEEYHRVIDVFCNEGNNPGQVSDVLRLLATLSEEEEELKENSVSTYSDIDRFCEIFESDNADSTFGLIFGPREAMRPFYISSPTQEGINGQNGINDLISIVLAPNSIGRDQFYDIFMQFILNVFAENIAHKVLSKSEQLYKFATLVDENNIDEFVEFITCLRMVDMKEIITLTGPNLLGVFMRDHASYWQNLAVRTESSTLEWNPVLGFKDDLKKQIDKLVLASEIIEISMGNDPNFVNERSAPRLNDMVNIFDNLTLQYELIWCWENAFYYKKFGLLHPLFLAFKKQFDYELVAVKEHLTRTLGGYSEGAEVYNAEEWNKLIEAIN